MRSDWDLIIIGSGPAGLATALAAKLNGVERVLILEKNSGVGNRLIGQSIHYKYEILKKVFQDKIPKEAFVSEIKTFKRKYYSSSGKNVFQIEDGIERVWIDFRIFLEELARLTLETGVKIRINSKVTNLNLNNKTIKEITVQDSQIKDFFRLKSNLVVIATGSVGYNTLNLHQLGLPIPSPICPIIANQFYGEVDSGLFEFFFHSNVHDNIAAISYIFPHRNNSAEYGTIMFPDLMDFTKTTVWEIRNKILVYPIIKERIDPLNFYNTTVATIAMGGPVSRVYANGGFIIGEAAGHVTPSGGSGILNSLEMGTLLGEELGKTYNEWCDEVNRGTESKIITHPTHIKLQLMAKMVIDYRKRLFLELGTWDQLDREWEEITNTLTVVFAKKS